MQQPDQSDIPLVGKEKKFKGYYKIARHYGWALNKTFFEFNYDTVLIVEGTEEHLPVATILDPMFFLSDDLELSVDFFEYFLALHPILKNDPTLFCVSAWNDNGKAGLVEDDPASSEFDLAMLRIILQRLEKSTDELTKANVALPAHTTNDEVLANMDSLLDYEDRTAGSVGLL
ncbi:hypothetical protein HPB51_004997 [Rhipicephalus microplus]|uniref:Alpha-1,3-mannosyl-glycoprotein 2-beta-N-acetylglucosaminyltransferase n=1 Tax=Rhipicephalus microplus TaxID=6941 RepID=A0A9J6DLJ8_RHIMP|nr:hypothetical protein HPB51_004997 [Rhipicephalus microplus]